MDKSLKRGKILFIDDRAESIQPFVDYLRDEGFTNLVVMASVPAFADVESHGADLVFLDITGVAAHLSAAEDGIAVLKYLKSHAPWIRVVVLSGSSFAVDSVSALRLADVAVSKASLDLAQLLALVEEQMACALAPERRNALVLKEIAKQLDDVPLSAFARWRINRLVARGLKHEGDSTFDWATYTKSAVATLKVAEALAPLVKQLTEG